MSQTTPADRKNPNWQRTVLLATDSSQSIVAELADGEANAIAYSAYGHQSAKKEVVTQLGFNGQLREANIGWYLLGNGYRAYNPRLMRFHSPDSWSPFGGGGLNAYMYCVGDPVNRVDPTGHISWIGVKRFFGNADKFLFGGSEITGPSRTKALHATGNTGRKMSVEHGDLAAMSKAGGAVSAVSPTVATTGKYPSMGDGSTHGMKWGITPAFLPSNRPAARPNLSGKPTSTAPSRRGSVRVLYHGPDPQHVPRPREEMTLLGRAPIPERSVYYDLSRNPNPGLVLPPTPTPTPPPTPPRTRSPSPWRSAMERTDAERIRDWDYDSD